MDSRGIEGLLGMAQRAGKVASGEFAVEKALASGAAALVLVASDASARARDEISARAAAKGVPVRVLLTKEALGRCLGREYRASAALLDTGFAGALEKRIQGMG